MKIDLHVHTRQRSPCALADTEPMLQAAIDSGLDGLAITDHDTLVPDDELDRLRARYAPFRIFRGIEVSVGDEHVLVHGVSHHLLEARQLEYPDLWHLVREHRGFMTLAHPFRYARTIDVDLFEYPPDALELRSRNTPRAERSRIMELTRQLGVAALYTSDAHAPADVGRYHVELERAVANDAELVAELAAGRFVGRSSRRTRDEYAPSPRGA